MYYRGLRFWTAVTCLVMLVFGLLLWFPSNTKADGKLTLRVETFSDASFTSPKTDFKQTDQIFVRVSLENYDLVSATGIEQIGFRVYYSSSLGSTAARTVGAAAAQMTFSSADLASDVDYPGLRAASFELVDKYKTVEDELGNETLVGDPIVQNGVLATFRINANQVPPAVGSYPLTIAKASLTTFNGDTAIPATSVKNPVTDFITFESTAINIVIPPGQISGQVTDAVGSSLSGVNIAALQSGVSKGTATSGVDGTYQLSLAPGTYDLKFTHANYRTVIVSTDVVSDQTSTVNQQLQPKTAITVTADAQRVPYGSPEAQLSYQHTGSLDNGDAFTGVLARASGSDVGVYAISQGSLALDTDKYTLTYVPAQYEITPKELTVTGLTVSDKEYDGTTAASFSGGTLSGILTGDTVSLGGSIAFVQKQAGTNLDVVPSLTLSGADADNYYLTQPTGLTASISQKILTVTGITIADKVYDGTTNAGYSGANLQGLVADDDAVTLSGTAAFASKDAGTGIAVATSLTLTGADAGNYQLTQPIGLTADIAKRDLTVTGLQVDSRVYDGSTAATYSGAVLNGVIAGETVTLSGTVAFADKAAGSGKTVLPSLSIAGADAANYQLQQPSGLTGTISEKELALTGIVVDDKEYDGTTAVTYTGGSLSGVVLGETVSFSGSVAFVDRTAGTNKPVNANFSLSGADAGNYNLTQPTGLTASISQKMLTVTGITIADKVYDGTTNAGYSGANLQGLVAGDAVTLGGAAAFASKDAGTGIAVATSLTLTGADAGNYQLTQPTGLIADIAKRDLTVTGLQVDSKVYDGSTAATYSGATLSGVIAGETVTLSGTVAFVDRAAGSGKAVLPSLSIAGADVANYQLQQPSGLTGTISKQELTVTGIVVDDKEYDGTTAATYTGGSLNGVVSGETVSFSGSVAFVDRSAGNSKPVNANFSLNDEAAGNYLLTQPSGLTASINQKMLTVTGITIADKVYDGTVNAEYSGASLQGLVRGDTVTLGGTATFASKDVGSGIAVTTSLTLADTDANNYQLTQPAGLTANITKRPLTVTANNLTKYVGASDPALTYSVATLASGDSKQLTFTGALSRQVGEQLGQYDILQGTLALTAEGDKNYTLTFVPGKLTVVSAPVYQPDPTPVTPPKEPDPVVEDGAATLPIAGEVEKDETGQTVAENYTADDKTAEQVQRAKELGASTVQLDLGLNAAATTLIKATVPASVLVAASDGTPTTVVMQTAVGGITLPPALVTALAEQNQPLTFTAQRLAPESVQEQLPEYTEAVADPLQIETALRGHTVVHMPVNIVLPTDEEERNALLKSYSVFAQHSDGPDETISDLSFEIDETAVPPVLTGISFSVEHFSTFTMVRSLPQPVIPMLTTRVGVASYQFGGETYAMEPCYYKGNDTMMTLRMLEPLGVQFDWHDATKTVTMIYGDKTVKLRIGSSSAEVNGMQIPIVAASGKRIAAEVRNGRTRLPLRFVSEQLGFQVHWEDHVITIKQ